MSTTTTEDRQATEEVGEVAEIDETENAKQEADGADAEGFGGAGPEGTGEEDEGDSSPAGTTEEDSESDAEGDGEEDSDTDSEGDSSLLGEADWKQGKTEVREVGIKLTDEEAHRYSVDLSELVHDIDGLEEEKKSVAAGYTAQIKAKRQRLTKLSDAVRSGEKVEELECTWYYDFASGRARLTADYDGRIIEERQMTAEERQAALEFQEEEFNGAAVEASTTEDAIDALSEHPEDWAMAQRVTQLLGLEPEMDARYVEVWSKDDYQAVDHWLDIWEGCQERDDYSSLPAMPKAIFCALYDTDPAAREKCRIPEGLDPAAVDDLRVSFNETRSYAAAWPAVRVQAESGMDHIVRLYGTSYGRIPERIEAPLHGLTAEYQSGLRIAAQLPDFEGDHWIPVIYWVGLDSKGNVMEDAKNPQPEGSDGAGSD